MHEVDATHARCRSIVGSQSGRCVRRHQLRQSSGPGGQVLCQKTKVGQNGMHRLSQAKAGRDVSAFGEDILQQAEHPSSSRHCQHKGPKLPQELLPFLNRGAALVGRDAVQNFEKPSDAMGGELNGHPQGVHGPSQDVLPGRPCCVALLHLLNGRWLLAERAVARDEAPKHRVEGGQECALDMLAVMRPALDQTNEVVYIDVPLFNRYGSATRDAPMGWDW
jgi:hypothetical protein